MIKSFIDSVTDLFADKREKVDSEYCSDDEIEFYHVKIDDSSRLDTVSSYFKPMVDNISIISVQNPLESSIMTNGEISQLPEQISNQQSLMLQLGQLQPNPFKQFNSETSPLTNNNTPVQLPIQNEEIDMETSPLQNTEQLQQKYEPTEDTSENTIKCEKHMKQEPT